MARKSLPNPTPPDDESPEPEAPHRETPDHASPAPPRPGPTDLRPHIVAAAREIAETVKHLLPEALSAARNTAPPTDVQTVSEIPIPNLWVVDGKWLRAYQVIGVEGGYPAIKVSQLAEVELTPKEIKLARVLATQTVVSAGPIDTQAILDSVEQKWSKDDVYKAKNYLRATLADVGLEHLLDKVGHRLRVAPMTPEVRAFLRRFMPPPPPFPMG